MYEDLECVKLFTFSHFSYRNVNIFADEGGTLRALLLLRLLFFLVFLLLGKESSSR